MSLTTFQVRIMERKDMAISFITFFSVGRKNSGMSLIKLRNSKASTIPINCAIGENLGADYCNVNINSFNNQRSHYEIFR
jgi:hypothetical protein